MCKREGTKHRVLIDEAVLQQRPDRLERIFETDLLALGILATGIGNGHLVDAMATLQHFGRDLALDLETVRAQRYGLDEVSPKDLVAGPTSDKIAL